MSDEDKTREQLLAELAGLREQLAQTSTTEFSWRRAEEALVQSEARVQAVLDNVVDGIITIDERGSVLAFNRAAERIFGYEAREVIGKNVNHLMPAPYHDEHDRYLRNYIQTGHAKIIGIGREVAGKRKDGSVFPVDLAVSEVKLPGLRLFTGIVRDISERKAAEAERERLLAELTAERGRLEAERDRAQSYLDVAEVMLVVIGADEQVVLVNRKGCSLLGYPEAEVVGQNWFDCFVPEKVRSALRDSHSRQLAGEAPPVEYSEHPVRTRAGEECLIAWHTAIVRDGHGQRVATLSSGEDITDRRRIEEERARIQARERALAQIAQALVRELELERVVGVVIEQSLQVLGVDAVAIWLADPVRRELRLIAHRNLGPRSVASLDRLSYDSPFLTAEVARTGQTRVVEDLQIDETSIWARWLYLQEGFQSLLAMPLRSQGRLVGVVTYLTRSVHRFSALELESNSTVADLFAVAIEHANLYQELQQALRLREEFLSAAAHELKTPVTTIKGWSELLLKTDVREARDRRGLETILRQSDRITRLTEDLLSLVRLRPGPPALSREVLDLGTLTREVVEQIERWADQHRFLVQVAEPLLVEADRSLIGEVLGNLIENAVRYTPGGGEVEVEARRVGGEAVFSVRDHGVGIAAERQAHIFEPFFEPVASGEPGYVGIVSIGLHLSKQIVETHGGRIWFVSASGKGSAFYVSLPLLPAPQVDGSEGDGKV